MVEIQTSLLKLLALVIIFPNMWIVVIYGKFDNEFLRISITVATGMHIYYSYIHFLVRIIALLANLFVIAFVEYWYMRESLMQCACKEIGQCLGGSTFHQLLPLKMLHINNGELLVDGHISYFWM